MLYDVILTYCSPLLKFVSLDVLERNLIINTVRWDLRDDKNKKQNQPKGLHLKLLVETINDVGISFQVWEKSAGSGKKANGYDWRSLVGNEKKQLLNCLPEKFDEVLHPDVCGTVKLIWQVNKLLTL